ncbi:hypothetical protein [Flavobacterium lindanitolerans]|uniref:hypothetical protein n=1 Tax=Flavobacterium lindanitolerans TaxID=428988 RepID=UPI00319ECB4C
MKKILLLTVIAAVLFSCGKSQNTLDGNIRMYIEKNADDPKSYEPIETSIIDTVHASEEALRLVKRSEGTYKQYENIKKQLTAMLNTANSPKEKAEIQNKLDITDKDFEPYIRQYKAYADFAKSVKNDEVDFYIAKHKCRIQNRRGVTEITEYVVLTDNDFNVMKVDEDNYAIDSMIYDEFHKKHNLQK